MSGLCTSEKIVEAATGLIKVRGYNAFSYQDISGLVGIRKASVHHHFSAKADLARAVVRRFAETFGSALTEIEREQPSGLARIMAFARTAGSLIDNAEMCPCAMLASEAETLPASVNEELQAYYRMVVGWLSRNVRQGREDGSIGLEGDERNMAQFILATVQGAAMTARCLKSRESFDAATAQLRRSLEAHGTRG